MKIIIYTFSLMALLMTVGCKPAHHPHHGDFCPPGQAKKGNC